MADIAVLGIGLDTRQAERNAKNLTQSLNGISASTGSMGKAFFASQIAFAAVSKAANFLKGELSAIVTTGMQFQASMSQVKAVSGATQAQFEQLTAAAKHLGETTKFSASEAANGLVLLSQAGLKAEQSIAALPDVLNLAAAGGLDMGTAADIATNAMSGMRLGVEDLARITDVFAKTASSSNTNVAAMGESFKYVASIGASAGVSVERLSAMIGILGNAGIQGSMAGTQLAFGISKMASEGKDFFTVLKELEATGASTAEVMDMFGERAGRAVLAILGQGVGTLEQFEAQLMNSAGAAKNMADIMSDNLAGDAKNLSSAIEAVRINFFDVFNDDLRAGVQAITGAIRENKDNVVGLAQPVVVLAGTFRDLTHAMGGLNNITAIVADGLKLLVSGFLITVHNTDQLIGVVSSGMSVLADTLRLIGSGFDVIGAGWDLLKAKMWSTEEGYKLATNGMTSATNQFKASFEAVGEGIVQESDTMSGKFGKLKSDLTELWSTQEKSTEKTKDATSAAEALAIATDKAAESAAKQAAKTKEAADSVGELSMASWEAAERAALQAAKAKEATEKTGELKEEALDLDAAFNALSRATQELNIATDDQKIKADFAAEALYRQKSAADSVAGSFQVATAEVKKYADQTSRAFATGSILGDMGGLVGSTFSVESPRATTASPTSQMAAFSSTSAPSGATSNISSLMSGYDRLANQITDYLQKDVGLDIKLKDAEQELRTLAGELANVGQNELEKQLELSEQYFATVRKIDDLQSQISKEQERTLRSQQSTAQGLGSILDSVLSDYDSLVAGDFAQLLPVERVQLLSEQFNATAEAIDSIDWTNITEADEQLIQQFQSVSKSFLDESQKVFKSSDNYTAIKDTVKGEFDDLATDLATAMAAADPATFEANMDKLKTSFAGLSENSASANTGVVDLSKSLYHPGSITALGNTAYISKDPITTLADTILNSLGANADQTKTKTATFAQTLAELSAANQGAADSAMSASNSAAVFSTGVNATATPLQTANSNITVLANNTSATMNFMAQQMAALKQAIEAGQSTVGGTPPATQPIAPAPEETWLKLFAQGSFGGLYDVYAQGSLGSTKKLPAVFYSSPYSGSTDTKISGKSASGSTMTYEILGGKVWKDGYAVSLATGAWSINRQTEPAMLHQGEMVIRSDDAPAVRSFMASTGRASSYGAQNSDSGAMGYDSKRMIELLAEIADLLSRGINPQVFLNAKKVSEELDRFRSLSA